MFYYGLVCAFLAAIPFLMTTSRTLLTWIEAFQVFGGVVGYLVHARGWKTSKKRAWSIAYFTLGFAAMFSFGFMLHILSPRSPAERLRERLIEAPTLTNFLCSIIMLICAFLIVSGITLLAEERAKAFSRVKRESFSPNVQWMLTTVGIAIAAGMTTLVFLHVPREYGWVRLPLVIAILVAVIMWLNNPHYLFRRMAVCLVLWWTAMPIGVTFFAKTKFGTLFVELSTLDWSFHMSMVLMVGILLFADWKHRVHGQRVTDT